jgi:alkylhydroperoxidase/carboxymuconolactone decarboxylase family protein YurZ
MKIRPKDLGDLRARAASAMEVIESAHKRAAEFQKTHPEIYAEIFGEKNLDELLNELRSLVSTLEEWSRRLIGK